MAEDPPRDRLRRHVEAEHDDDGAVLLPGLGHPHAELRDQDGLARVRRRPEDRQPPHPTRAVVQGREAGPEAEEAPSQPRVDVPLEGPERRLHRPRPPRQGVDPAEPPRGRPHDVVQVIRDVALEAREGLQQGAADRSLPQEAPEQVVAVRPVAIGRRVFVVGAVDEPGPIVRVVGVAVLRLLGEPPGDLGGQADERRGRAFPGGLPGRGVGDTAGVLRRQRGDDLPEAGEVVLVLDEVLEAQLSGGDRRQFRPA